MMPTGVTCLGRNLLSWVLPLPPRSWDLTLVPVFFFPTAVGAKTPSLALGVLDLGEAITIWVCTEGWREELG
jgi:hypothetical protein